MKKVLFSIIALTLVSVIFTSCSNHGDKVEFKNLEVYYKDGAEKADAEKLGKYLEPMFTNNPETATVQLIKEGEMFTVRFVMREDAELTEENLELMRTIQREISKNVFDSEGINMHLCNNKLETEKELKWNE
jgi:hypothetical protein